MQHVLHAVDRAAGDLGVRQVAFEEFHGRKMIEVAALARDQAVDDADAMAAPDELFREMRPDEARAAGDEI